MNNCLYNILLIIFLLAIFNKTNVPEPKTKVNTNKNYKYVPFLKTYVTNVNNKIDHCDQSPNSESKCKVDFSFKHCMEKIIRMILDGAQRIVNLLNMDLIVVHFHVLVVENQEMKKIKLVIQ